MLRIQELSEAMPLDPHQGSAPGSRGLRSAAIEGLPPSPQAPPLDPALKIIKQTLAINGVEFQKMQ